MKSVVTRAWLALKGLVLRRRSFDPMNWTPDQVPRAIVFMFESPEPFMLPDGTTFSFMLDREIEWLRNVRMKPVRESDAWRPEEHVGHIFVSFRFWRSTTPVSFNHPSEGLMEVIRRVMPPERNTPSSVGVVGLDEYEDYEGEDDDEDDAIDEEGGSPDSEAELEHAVTVVEAVTPLLSRETGASPIVEALHRCADSLTEFSRVYRLANRLPMQPVTYETLPPTVFWATRNLFNEEGNVWDERVELLTFPSRMPGRTQHPELDDRQLEIFTSYYESYRLGNPLIPYSERTLDARLSFETLGDYTNCVIQCQTAVEVLLDGLLSLLLWEEKLEPEKVAKEIFTETLHKRVRTHFGPRLGGDWNTKGGGSVARWAQVLVPLRNRTVHAAYRPTRGEAGEALAIVSDIDDFFRTRLVTKRNSYMRVTLMILGQPGLERFGAWSGKIKRFAERANEEPSWDRSFKEWQSEVMKWRESLESQTGVL